MGKRQIKPTLTKGIAKVPVVMQLEALECGAAALAMVMAYYGKWVPLEQVRVETQEKPKAVILTFLDQGAPFDPPVEERPDTTSLPARERPMGGLGLYLARSLVDEIAYARRDGRNVLTVRKEIEQGGTEPWQSP